MDPTKSYPYQNPHTTYARRAPMAGIEIARVGRRNERLPFSALIDSGADLTCLPWFAYERLFPFKNARSPMEHVYGVGGKAEGVRWTVAVWVEGTFIQDLEVMFIKGLWGYALLGRDVLNQYTLTLDGPALNWFAR